MSSDSGDSFYWIRVILASTWGTHGVGHIPNCDVRPHNSDADWRQNHRGKRHSQTTSPLHRRPQKSKATIHLILRVIVSLSWALDQRTGHRLYGLSVGRCRTVSAFRFRNFLLYCHRRSCWTFCRCRSNGPRHNLFHLTWHGKVYALFEIFYRQNLYCPTWWACWSSNQPAITAISTQATHQALLHVHHQNNQSSSVCARLQLVRHIAGTDISYRVDG